jgi:hypothetical protein
MSWKSDYELDNINPYDDKYYKWVPIMDRFSYDYENEYYTMICELAEKLGVNPSDIADY